MINFCFTTSIPILTMSRLLPSLNSSITNEIPQSICQKHVCASRIRDFRAPLHPSCASLYHSIASPHPSIWTKSQSAICIVANIARPIVFFAIVPFSTLFFPLICIFNIMISSTSGKNNLLTNIAPFTITIATATITVSRHNHNNRIIYIIEAHWSASINVGGSETKKKYSQHKLSEKCLVAIFKNLIFFPRGRTLLEKYYYE